MNYDKKFLLSLDQQKIKRIYARVTALNFDESPIETIEGRVIQGSINLDGTSAIRRSCSLTLTTKDFRYNNYYWSLQTKFKLEIGIENNIDSKYEKIIWFNQGIYLITSFQSSLTVNNFTISISGKDKMVLLNGEMGGMVNFTTDFSKIEEEIDGEWKVKDIPIYEIIKNIVHTYAKEPYQNIVIKDLDIQGKEMLEYRKEQPLYLGRKSNSNFYNKLFQDEEQYCSLYFPDITGQIPMEFIKNIKLKDIEEIDLEQLINLEGINFSPKLIKFENDENYYYLIKIKYGQTAGYRQTDLIIPREQNLITNAGQSVVTVLDNIIKIILNDYEYFYNLEGQFVFQKKPIYINSPWTPLQKSNDEFFVNSESSKYSYNFNDAQLIVGFNNQENISNLKNDFSVTGTRKTVNGIEVPILMRYAIDKKPFEYTSIFMEEGNEELLAYCNKNQVEYKSQISKKYTIKDYDWREIIYQMSKDEYQYGHLSDFQLRVSKANRDVYPFGITGYEQYYKDIYSLWRDLYNPHIWSINLLLDKKITKLQEQLLTEKEEEKIIIIQKKIDSLTNKKINDQNYYYYLYDKNGNITYQEKILDNIYIDNSNKNIYDKNNKKIVMGKSLRPNLLTKIPSFNQFSRQDVYNKKNKKLLLDKNNKKKVIGKYLKTYYTDSNLYWNKNVYENPNNLDFWFDFLDNGELQRYRAQIIGNRPKAINDTNVKAIYFKETPDLIFVENEEDIDKNLSYNYIKYENIEKDFSISTQGYSAKDKIDDLLYQYSYVINNAAITSIPIYYLEPNTRIYIYDEKTQINGDYIINKLIIPLTYNGTMSITASRVVENFIG